MSFDLVTGDALAVLRSLDAGSVDAIITDPPYCSGAFTESGKQAAKKQGLRGSPVWFAGDNMTAAGIAYLLRSVAFEACRVLKDGGSLSTFADWRMVSLLGPAMESAGLRMSSIVVWDKGSPALGNGFRAQHEFIIHLTKGSGAYYEKGTGNVLRCKRVHHTKRQHPTEKPVELMRKLVRLLAPVGGLVVDPFAGAGSTGLAAVAEGRRFIGCDRASGFVDVAQGRAASGVQGGLL